MLVTDSGKGLKKILVIRLSAMGDVLLTTPLLRLLKKKFPETEIDFLVKQEYSSLISTNPYIHQMQIFSQANGFFEFIRICLRMRNLRYDGIIDLQVNVRSFFLRILSNAKWKVRYKPWRWKRFFLVHFHRNYYKTELPVPLRFLSVLLPWGIQDDGLGLELIVDEKTRSMTISCMKKREIRLTDKIIALAPGASKMTKRWPSEDFAAVGNYFMNRNYKVVLVGGDQDRQVCEEVTKAMGLLPEDFSGQLTLQETAALIAESDILITNDTGVMHIGSALKKRVVAIFGPTTNHLGFMPFRTQSIVVEKSLYCRPCSYHGTDTCPQGHFRCMKSIQVDDVIQAVKNLLDEK